MYQVYTPFTTDSVFKAIYSLTKTLSFRLFVSGIQHAAHIKPLVTHVSSLRLGAAIFSSILYTTRVKTAVTTVYSSSPSPLASLTAMTTLYKTVSTKIAVA